MKTDRPFIDQFWIGLFLGVLGIGMGALLLGGCWVWSNGSTLDYFIHDVMLGSLLYRDSILTTSALFNLIMLWFINRQGWDKCALGVLAVTLLTIPFILYFQSFAGTW